MCQKRAIRQKEKRFSSSAVFTASIVPRKNENTQFRVLRLIEVFGNFCALCSNAAAVPRGHTQHFGRPCLLLSINIVRIVLS